MENLFNDRGKIVTFSNALLDRVRTLPGVQSAGIGSNAPLDGRMANRILA